MVLVHPEMRDVERLVLARERNQAKGFDPTAPCGRKPFTAEYRAFLRESIRSMMAIDGEKAQESGIRFNQEAPWMLIDRELTRDVRGLDQEARSSLWSFLSRRTVALRGRGVAGKVSWTIRRPEGVTPYAHVKSVMMGGSSSADMYDYFFAWRCQCEAQHEWLLEHPKKLPRNDGYYGNCSMCGAVALEIRTR
jgi:hypothetical protein